VLGVVWVALTWFRPTWRVWALCLVSYVLILVAFHASIILPMADVIPVTMGRWASWAARETPLFVVWTAMSAVIVGVRGRPEAVRPK
jgi:hypothetical protein